MVRHYPSLPYLFSVLFSTRSNNMSTVSNQRAPHQLPTAVSAVSSHTPAIIRGIRFSLYRYNVPLWSLTGVGRLVGTVGAISHSRPGGKTGADAAREAAGGRRRCGGSSRRA